MTTRREALAALASVPAAWMLVSQAQTPRHMPRIGILTTIDQGADKEDLIRALKESGYVDRASAMLEWRSAEGKSERLAELADELVRLKVDVIIALGSGPTQVVKRTTSSIPIVFEAGDPVGAGFVPSLGRPTGNLTGISIQLPDFAPKCLQLLKDVRPELTELTVLFSPGNASATYFLREAESAAPRLQLRIQPVTARTPADLESALAAIERARPRAMIVLDDYGDRVGAFAIRNRIAALGLRQFADRAFLISYGITSVEISRQLAVYVDRILKGAKPADLPVQQPTKFELVINTKTARAIGVAIPQSMLLRADEVIQ
jgi:putative ABC transport system substrate-binding protein